MVLTVFMLSAQHESDGVEKKPTSSQVVRLETVLNRIPPSSRGRKVAKQSNQPSEWLTLTKDMQAEHELIRMNEVHQYIK